MKNPTQENIDPTAARIAAHTALHNCTEHEKNVYANWRALTSLASDLEADTLGILGRKGDGRLNLPNARGEAHQVAGFDETQRFAAACVMLDRLNASPAFAEIRAKVEPLYIEHERCVAAEQAAAEELARITGEHRQRLTEAREKALAAVEEAPEVVAARTALEAVASRYPAIAERQGVTVPPVPAENPALVRGRNL